MTALRRWSLYIGFVLSLALALVLMARANEFTFPYPWNDEARFYLPALWWSEHHTLAPAILNAPNGIFWMPDGFAVTIGEALELFGRTMATARATCQLLVAGGMVVFAIAFQRFTRSFVSGAICTLLLLAPPVVFMADEVRMEAVLFLVIAVSFFLYVYDWKVAAGAVLFAGVLVHPAVGLAAGGYGAALLVQMLLFKQTRKVRPAELVIVAAVAGLYVAECVHIWRHAALYKAHMGLQVQRKFGRTIGHLLLNVRGAIVFSEIVILAGMALRWVRAGDLLSASRAAPVAAIGLGVALYAVLGDEMTYNVYETVITPALILAIALRPWPARPSGA